MENEDNSTVKVTADINVEQRKANLEKALDVSAFSLIRHPKDVAHNIRI